ncbi:S-layer homology domain-containing protein [Candidatus Peregrinibacteria bacterium]|nr:S-layer homology domain-containing protein [Candidatus Peregrinibacteria bacterium]
MFRKLISVVGVGALLAMLIPGTVLAATFGVEEIIQNVQLSVGGGTPQTFNPGNAQELASTLTFSPDLAQELSNSTGSVVVTTKANQNTVLKTLVSWSGAQVPAQIPNWNGKSIDNTAGAQAVCGNAGNSCPNGEYVVKVHAEYTSGANTFFDDDTADFNIGGQSSITIDTFNVAVTSGGPTFDPSPNGNNADLQVSYTLNAAADNVSVEIKNSDDDVMKSFNSSNVTATFSWDGQLSNKLVLPGDYTVTVRASKTGEQDTVQTKQFTVAYDNQNKGDISDFKVDPSAFDPDVEDTVIEFTNTKDADLTLRIEDTNGNVIDTFSDFTDTNYGDNSKHIEVWDGRNNAGNIVGLSTYKVVVISRNEYGVVVKKLNVIVNDAGGSVDSSNEHIAGIDLNPSKTFEPEKDDELEIEWDTEKDLDDLKIFAVRGSEKIEIYDEQEVEQENNLQTTWDGTDEDDEYADAGSWKIQFESKIGSTTLIAAKTITIDYEKPKIEEIEVSKKEIDNDEDEIMYLYFKVKDDAQVDVKILQDGDEDDDLVEDMDVEAGKWYAVEWDGGSYDYDDDMELKVIAKNRVNDNVFDSKKITVDLDEDTVSSSKSNVLRDYISPVVSDGKEIYTLSYYLDDDADEMEITIHSGKSSSGSKVVTLLDGEEQEAGEHFVEFDPIKPNGTDWLSNGFYTYKIVSKQSGTDTESGIFLVTSSIGDVEGGAGPSGSSSSDSDDDSDGNTAPNVIVNGDSQPAGGQGEFAGTFKDVSANSAYAEAIEWVYEEGIFQGYGDGTFKPNQPISRVEILKVILLALGVNVQNPPAADKLGFSDVILGDWYMPFVYTAKTLGIFQGDGGGLKAITTARPAETVNRAEALKMVFETLKKQQGTQISSCEQPYNDIKAADWFYNYVCGAKNYELFDTVSGNFVPGAHSTRGEMAELFYRLHLSGLI